jgi:glycosyltransferase involved in cell wall biosynthesis
MEPLSLVIPTFNEAETIGAVIREIPPVSKEGADAARLRAIIAQVVALNT